MKEYKKNQHSITNLHSTVTNYRIYKKCHGLYRFFSIYRNNIEDKGYYNMGEKYGHWLLFCYIKRINTFKYFL